MRFKINKVRWIEKWTSVLQLFPHELIPSKSPIWQPSRGQILRLLLFISTDQTWTLVNDQQKPEKQSNVFASETAHWGTDALEQLTAASRGEWIETSLLIDSIWSTDVSLMLSFHN